MQNRPLTLLKTPMRSPLISSGPSSNARCAIHRQSTGRPPSNSRREAISRLRLRL
jgi:hypothetical protein